MILKNLLLLIFIIPATTSIQEKNDSQMIILKNTIAIDAPVDRVFSFLHDFENIPKWNYYVMQVNPINGADCSEGSTYHQIRKSDEQYFEVKHIVSNELIEIHSLPNSSMQFQRKMVLHRSDGKTIVQDELKLNTKFPGWLEWLAKGRIRKAISENLYKLKELMETNTTVLQDGRMVKLN